MALSAGEEVACSKVNRDTVDIVLQAEESSPESVYLLEVTTVYIPRIELGRLLKDLRESSVGLWASGQAAGNPPVVRVHGTRRPARPPNRNNAHGQANGTDTVVCQAA